MRIELKDYLMDGARKFVFMLLIFFLSIIALGITYEVLFPGEFLNSVSTVTDNYWYVWLFLL